MTIKEAAALRAVRLAHGDYKGTVDRLAAMVEHDPALDMTNEERDMLVAAARRTFMEIARTAGRYRATHPD
jgi:hypothetical protein